MKEHLRDKESNCLLEDLFGSCTKYKYMVSKMPDIMEDSEEELIRYTIRVNDHLLEVIDKYNRMQFCKNSNKTSNEAEIKKNINSEIKNERLEEGYLSASIDKTKSKSLLSEENPIDELVEIFADLSTECLIPAVVNNERTVGRDFQQEVGVPKKGVLHSTIDELSADLFDNSFKLQNFKTFSKENSKISLNELLQSKKEIDYDPKCTEKTYLFKKEENLINSKKISKETYINSSTTRSEDILFPKDENKSKSENKETTSSKEPKYLSDIVINFNEILPSNHQQIILTDSKEGLKVTLDFAKNKPLEHTSVLVVSITNQSQLPIGDFKLDAFVNKPCKLRLFQRDGNFLEGVKPFHPPSDCLHQLMLIYNPTKKPLEVTFTFSYIQGEDPDLIKESLVSALPYFN